jgi:metal-dependent HD superfamily phosphatase/phosphodiesterase
MIYRGSCLTVYTPEPIIYGGQKGGVEMPESLPEVVLDQELMEAITNDERIKKFVDVSDSYMALVGYTRHGYNHVTLVARRAQRLALELGYGQHAGNMAYLAGYVHDTGNFMGRQHHGPNAALLIYPILMEYNLPFEDIVKIMSAVANHEEEIGEPVNEIAAFLVLADKSDVHRNRVREIHDSQNDIHDKVNLATQEARLITYRDDRIIELRVDIDTEIASVMEYFECFTDRMVMSRRAASFLGFKFRLVINGQDMS